MKSPSEPFEQDGSPSSKCPELSGIPAQFFLLTVLIPYIYLHSYRGGIEGVRGSEMGRVGGEVEVKSGL